MCNCISYNKPQEYQMDKEIVIKPPFQEKSVCIDNCIIDEIKELWDNGFITLGSCCGHNGEFERNIVVDETEAKRVKEYIDKHFKRKWIVYSWKLTREN